MKSGERGAAAQEKAVLTPEEGTQKVFLRG
jgi:hypothetical protein